MIVIANVGYDIALQYKNKQLSTKIENKKSKLYLRLLCDDFNLYESIELAKSCPSVICLEYQGMLNNEKYLALTENLVGKVYITRVYQHGNDINESDIEGLLNENPSPVTVCIGLPEDYVNLKFVQQMCRTYPRVRFFGGSLFPISGVRLGCIGSDIMLKHIPKFTPKDYGFATVDVCPNYAIETLEVEATDKPVKERKISTGSSSSSEPKQHKVKKTLMFADIFNNGGAVLP